uniref:Transcription elongation factor, mitochondrial n=1 Tax=Oncorhynchus tshawytscha TaxID=74940 RepID=A0A8C8LWF7_ONCTS
AVSPFQAESSYFSPDLFLLERITNYTRDVILQLLNSAAESELAAVKLLRGRKSVNIVEYRTRNGPLENLGSVTNVPLLKHKSAVIVFNSILNPPEKEKSKDPASQVHQTIGGKDLEANSIVSIVCGVNKIAWAHVDHGMNLLEWKHEDCHNFLKGTYMASAYLDDISSVLSHLPTADFFVVEKTSEHCPVPSNGSHAYSGGYAVHPAGAQPDITAPPKVLNMMRTAVSRHFSLMVGESRTSGAQAVQRMMESVTQTIPRVTFHHNLLVKYRNSFQVGGRRNCIDSPALALL